MGMEGTVTLVAQYSSQLVPVPKQPFCLSPSLGPCCTAASQQAGETGPAQSPACSVWASMVVMDKRLM